MNQVVRQLFEELADLPLSERERLLAERRVPAEIRAEVESLLHFDSPKVTSFVKCVSGAAQELLKDSAADHCGPYRLVELLGSGGMGSVYLAERIDGEIHQQVAIKLLGAGGHRPVWRDRFLKERQLLASLHHPSIVHVIDAGHTEEGRPYLAMEYVDGVPIDVYAAQLEPRERLKLFLRVCEGISHAHRHLIIHRDLKPSNILVDASGQPKLLDFGIAKLLDETGEPTQTVERLLTPNYASPEQLRGGTQTTATDVYSLGAVLYKLLTGFSPHETEDHSSAAMEVVAGTRQIPPPTRLNPALPADIDYILRKALRTEPEERYASVDAFADDLRALLEWRPVQARSGDIWYRTRTFARRYRLPVAATAITLVALSAGLYIANRERAIAQRRFLEVRQLANKLFDIDAEVRQAPGTTKARQLIVDTSLDYLRRLASEVRGDPELALEVGNAYMRVARVQGVPMPGNLGQMAQADESLKSGERLVESVLSAQPGNRLAMLRSAQIAHDRMMVAWWLRQPRGESLAFAKKSAERLDAYVSTGTVDSAEIDAVLLTSINVATQYLREDQPDEALRISRRALDRARTLNRPRRAGALLEIIAGIDCQQGNLDEALGAIQESVKLMEPPKGTDDMGKLINFTMVLMRQSQILDDGNGVSLGRPEEAALALRRAFQIAEDISRRDPNDFSSSERFAETGMLLAHALRDTDARQSAELYDRAYRRMAEFETNSQARRLEVQALTGSIHPLLRLRRYAEGRPRLDAAFLRLEQLQLFPADQVEPGSDADHALRARAEYEAATGAPARALETSQRLLTLLLASKPQPEIRLSDALSLSNLYQEIEHLARQAQVRELAAGLESRRLELWRHWDLRLPGNPFVRRQLEAAGTPPVSATRRGGTLSAALP